MSFRLQMCGYGSSEAGLSKKKLVLNLLGRQKWVFQRDVQVTMIVGAVLWWQLCVMFFGFLFLVVVMILVEV